MTTADRAIKIVEENRTLYRTVPHETNPHVCGYCLGAVSDYSQCYACFEIFLSSTCPVELGNVVPMSIVVRPSPNRPSAWYTALRTYKTTQWKEYAGPIAALAYLWLNTHRTRLAERLGGEPDAISIVPSKRRDIDYATQPLRRLLSPFDEQLQQTLRCCDSSVYDRTKYTPEMFESTGLSVAGKRIILVEDTWITGATAVSAAGALLDAGAASVVITPIAREFNPNFYAPLDHPYAGLLVGDFDIDAWPRLPPGTTEGWT